MEKWLLENYVGFNKPFLTEPTIIQDNKNLNRVCSKIEIMGLKSSKKLTIPSQIELRGYYNNYKNTISYSFKNKEIIYSYDEENKHHFLSLTHKGFYNFNSCESKEVEVYEMYNFIERKAAPSFVLVINNQNFRNLHYFNEETKKVYKTFKFIIYGLTLSARGCIFCFRQFLDLKELILHLETVHIFYNVKCVKKIQLREIKNTPDLTKKTVLLYFNKTRNLPLQIEYTFPYFYYKPGIFCNINEEIVCDARNQIINENIYKGCRESKSLRNNNRNTKIIKDLHEYLFKYDRVTGMNILNVLYKQGVLSEENLKEVIASLMDDVKYNMNKSEVMDEMQPLIEELMTPNFCSRYHLESFDSFILNDIPAIIAANKTIYSDIDPNFYLTYKTIKITKPSFEEDMNARTIFPNECRIRDLTYSANLYVDIEYIKDKQIVVKNDMFIGKIPVMLKSILCHLKETNKSFTAIKPENLKYPVIQSERKKDIFNLKSKECPFDFGGYFIVNGVERVILIQEQLSKNRILIESDKKHGRIANVTSSTVMRKSKTGVYLNKNDVLFLRNNIFISDVPLFIVLKAFGLVSDKEIIESFGYEQNILDKLEASIDFCIKEQILTQKQALIYLSKFLKIGFEEKNKIKVTRKIINEVILPNIMNEKTNQTRKTFTLCLMGRFLFLNENIDDIDFMGNKRLELSGQLLSLLFEDTFIRFNTELKKQFDKVLSRTRSENFDALSYLTLQVNLITNAFNRAISTGNWVLKRFRMEKKGVTQVLSRLSYTSAVGMMTRIQSQFEKSRKVSGPRALHTSSFGVICPNDTPEGESCGLVKNLSLLAHITLDLKIKKENVILEIKEAEKDETEDLIYNLNILNFLECKPQDLYSGYLIFFNGSILGVTFDYQLFIERFKNLRRNNLISSFASIYKCEQKKSVFISSDSGRICRPLIVLKDNKSLLTKNDIQSVKLKYKLAVELFEEGKLEYLDINECNDTLISFFDPQRMGFDVKNEEIDNVEEYAYMEISDYTMLGYIASLIPFPNHNQSPRNTYQCAMSKQSMGIIHSFYRDRYDILLNILTYAQAPISMTRTHQFLPSGHNAMVAVMSYSGYDIEDALVINKASIERGFGRTEVYKTFKAEIKEFEDGTSQKIDFKIYPGEKVEDGEYFINLTNDYGSKEFSGERYKGLDPSILDRFLLTKSNVSIAKARLRQVRMPIVGDKFSSRHGQKGVVGLIEEEENLPFSENGMKPDIIMNPHGYPSRMTVGKILELITGKIGVLEGKKKDCTIFSDRVEEYCDTLQKYGFSYSGKDSFYCGITGEIMDAYVFFGPIYYQRLKHMVSDKMHARARGPRAFLTRQPTEGRSKEGGLRLGEMERDCLVGYGVSQIILERLCHSSDGCNVLFCGSCGLILTKKECCGENIECIIPYAFKLLLFELLAMNIVPRLSFSRS